MLWNRAHIWLDDVQATRVVLATADDDAPRSVTLGSFLLVPRAWRATSIELLLFQSSGPQQRILVTCEQSVGASSSAVK